jgi:hypothetical protein
MVGAYSSSFWRKKLGIKREILVGAESAKNPTGARPHSRGRGRAQADSPQVQPATPWQFVKPLRALEAASQGQNEDD